MRLFALILSSHKFPLEEQAIEETWAREFDDYVFATDETSGLRRIKFSEFDGHPSCMDKRCNGLIWTIDNRRDFDYYFTCDQDTFVNIDALRRFCALQNKNKFAIYGKYKDGHEIGSYAADTTLAYCSGGHGILFNRSVFPMFRERLKYYVDNQDKTNLSFDDVAIGLICRELDIGLNGRESFIDQFHPIENINGITAHYISGDKQREYHEAVLGARKKIQPLYEFSGSGVEKEVYNTILSLIKPGDTIVEFGSGQATTGNLAPYFNMYSVEHDKVWVGKFPYSKYIYAPIVDGWYDADILRRELPKKYDLLIIDGPGNRDDFLKYPDLIPRDIPIVMHDTNRHKEWSLGMRLMQYLGRPVSFYDTSETQNAYGVISGSTV